jgi:hypothetical protein
MRKYSLSINKLVSIDEERSGLVLQAKDPVNIPALARRFFVEEGIGSIEDVLPIGDGSDIEAEVTPDIAWLVDYSVRFDRCLAKCAKRHDWKFKVSKGGEVTFLSSSGDHIPDYIGAEKKRLTTPDKVNAPKDGKKYFNENGTKDKVKKNED